MSVLRVAIADDEPLARMRIARLLSSDPSIRVVLVCENATELARGLRITAVDVIFLDIEMPEKDGFSLVSELALPLPRIVFVTAYSEYATRAFDIDATDYLIKPVSQERLLASVERVRRDLAASASPRTVTNPAAFPQRMPFPIGRRTRLVEVDTIDRVLAQSNYLEIRAGANCYVIRRSISWMECQLDPRLFVRVHRSHIVRVAVIAQVEAQSSGRYRLVLKNGDELFSARNYRERIRETLVWLDA
ncbi:MAG: response regulator transcription factor [Rhodanobacteraceae bacterium]|nr:response regulator transcription factor [Rhodanobacteraceae bacterium]